MEAGFWHERWEKGRLGFHQAEANARLAKYWPRLEIENDTAVFVPLCGKSVDMVWIRDQGHGVRGIELSPIAVKAFFDEANVSCTETRHGSLQRFAGSGYEIDCGDFFDLEASDLQEMHGVYDRAALIALPPEMRRRYAARMARILPRRAKILLLTIEYDESKMNGPPHSVTPAEVDSLFGAEFEIEILESTAPSDPGPYFKERGLDVLREHVMLLTRRDPKASGA